MQAVTNAKGYDITTWLVGILRSFISGGAAALTTGTGGAVIGIPGPMIWKLMGINFVLLGLYRMGEFLTLHGAPDPVAAQVSLDKAEAASKEAVANVQEAKAAISTDSK